MITSIRGTFPAFTSCAVHCVASGTRPRPGSLPEPYLARTEYSPGVDVRTGTDSSVTETAVSLGRIGPAATTIDGCSRRSPSVPPSPADYAAIARITRDAYLAAGYFESADHPYMQQIQDVATRADRATIWVAERAGTIVGSVTLALAGEKYADIALDDELEFRMLVVDPAVQRSGAGRAMVEAIIAHAGSLDGIRAVALTTGGDWESAHGLYRKTGFAGYPSATGMCPAPT
jgi:GNAT superfamily N-acetyltransferase